MSSRPVRASLIALLLAAAILRPCGPAAASARVAGNVWTVDPDTASLVILDAGHKITVYCDADTVIRQGYYATYPLLLCSIVALAIAGTAPSPRVHPSPTPRMP